jgi:hypothetical protein
MPSHTLTVTGVSHTEVVPDLLPERVVEATTAATKRHAGLTGE